MTPGAATPPNGLDRLLRDLRAERRPGTFTFVTVDGPAAVPSPATVWASVVEPEGLSLVVTVQDAVAAGLPVGFRAAWISFGVTSALEVVGLTAAVSTALAEAGIAANVIAGHHHDHVLVAEDDAERALAVLGRWNDGAGDQPSSRA